MSKENIVSIKIPAKDMEAMQQKLQEINAMLGPHLVALQPSQRQELPKMSDKTIPFVEKVVEYTQSCPEFIPPYMKASELKIDFKAVTDLTQLYRQIEQLCKNLDDTIMLSGSEAYTAALTYYNSVKQASKTNVPNAKPVFDDLKKRFER